MAVDASMMPRIPVSVLRSFSHDILMAVGMDSDLADQVAHSLATADARSISSHGVVRLLPEYVRRLSQGSTNPTPTIRTISRQGSAALLDGDSAPGQVAGHAAMDMAIAMARSSGVGTVGVRNSSHFGMGALYAERAADAGMIGFAFTNATPNMPAAGGRGRFFGTNPLAIAVPNGDSDPLVLDMSTSVVARGKIVMAQMEGRPIPEGWAIDANGHPTVDPADALQGAVLPMAGYKGSGLALMIDVLCGVLTGASFATHVVDLYDKGSEVQDVGHFFLAIAVDAFMPMHVFKERLNQFTTEIREQPRMPGVDRIYLPGELEFESARRAEEQGVALGEGGWDELNQLARRWNVSPFEERLRLAQTE